MSHLRTYRVLPLLVGLLLLLGAATPAVLAACAMHRTEATSIPIHDRETPVLPIHTEGLPCHAAPATEYHACCQADATMASSATMCSHTAPRVSNPPLASVLSDVVLPALVQPSLLHSTRARAPSRPSTHRQALLATFLI